MTGAARRGGHALVGTMIAPGIGTVIGGGLGALTGALAMGGVVRKLKEWWKYGRIKEALTEIGDQCFQLVFEQGVDLDRARREVYRSVYDGPSWEQRLARQETLSSAHPRPGPYDHNPITPSSQLVAMYRDECELRVRTFQRAADRVPGRLVDLARSVDGPLDTARLGALVAANADHFRPLVAGLSGQLDAYRDEVRKHPHHPYRPQGPNGPVDARDVFATRCDETAREALAELAAARTPPPEARHAVNVVLLVAGAAALAALAYVAVSAASGGGG